NIATVSQEVPSGDETPLEFLFKSDKERSSLLAEIETSQDPIRIADIYDRLMIIDAYSAESRANNILKGLGFSDDDQNRSLSSFSGGLRMRIALAAALFIRPDLLLFDEPTNHLDIESIIWLEEFLKNYSKNVIVISHEREFLNKIVDHVFHLNNKIITTYKGNYDKYEEKYQAKLMNDLAYNKKIDAQKAHMQKFVDRFGAKATKAKQAQSRVKAISKLLSIAINNDDDSIKFSFTEVEDLPSPIISFNKVDIGYGSKIILKNISQNIDNDDKIALLGANGNGKSTVVQSLLFLRRTIEHCGTWNPNSLIYQYEETNGLNVELNGSYCLSLGGSDNIQNQIAPDASTSIAVCSANGEVKVEYSFPEKDDSCACQETVA
ncbi:MAG: ABC-F family ATP-binding cassette domain-containing protein, partial [Flavobacterium sp.]